jgi:TetR/AcrR family transcriptional regulator
MSARKGDGAATTAAKRRTKATSTTTKSGAKATTTNRGASGATKRSATAATPATKRGAKDATHSTKRSTEPTTTATKRRATATIPPRRRAAAQDDAAGRTQQRRRRSDDPGHRRDPARTRQLILDSASEEFGRYGYDGARVMRIAERAGVAHQLITYHFGGKKGLFDALSDQWIAASRNLAERDATFLEVLPALVHHASNDTAWERAMIREGQGQDHGDLVERLAPLLDNARQRQERGEIAPDLDPGIVTLVFFAANLAPTALPHITRAFSKIDPSDPAFVDYYAEQLTRIIKYLGATSQRRTRAKQS